MRSATFYTFHGFQDNNPSEIAAKVSETRRKAWKVN